MESGQLADGADVVDQHIQAAQLLQDMVVKFLKLVGLGHVHRLKKVSLALHFLIQSVQAGLGTGAPATRAPALPNASARARPMPSAAPVMRTLRSFKSKFMLEFSP